MSKNVPQKAIFSVKKSYLKKQKLPTKGVKKE